MKYLLLFLFCVLTFGCSQEPANKFTNSTSAKTIPTVSPALTKEISTNTKVEENLAFLDSKKKGKTSIQIIERIKTSLDYLVEHTSSSREEIAEITNKIIPELEKSRQKPSREEFLWVCKSMMQMNNIEEKLGEKPDFANLAAYVAGDIETHN